MSKHELPNDGVLTSYGATVDSLMSGSQEEWNRMNQLIKEKGLKKNFVETFQLIEEEGIVRQKRIQNLGLVLSEKQFKLDICERTKDDIAIRFHSLELQHYGIKIAERNYVASAWWKLYKAKCFNDKPMMFTFYQPVAFHGGDPGIETYLEKWQSMDNCRIRDLCSFTS